MDEPYTLVYPYFENERMLAHQVQNWNRYDEELKSRIRIVLIDDCSRRSPAQRVFANCRLQKELYRITTAIPWNQHGARNLGARVARTERCVDPWMFMCDMDIVLTPDMARALLATNHDTRSHYTFARIVIGDPACTRYPVNVYSVKHSVYWTVGGYDEDYCGTYGGDLPFLRQLHQIAPRVHREDIRLVGYLPSVIPDASTTDYTRNGHYRRAYLESYRRKRLAGNERAREPLRFAWERVM
jgi:hypothetical protein